MMSEDDSKSVAPVPAPVIKKKFAIKASALGAPAVQAPVKKTIGVTPVTSTLTSTSTFTHTNTNTTIPGLKLPFYGINMNDKIWTLSGKCEVNGETKLIPNHPQFKEYHEQQFIKKYQPDGTTDFKSLEQNISDNYIGMRPQQQFLKDYMAPSEIVKGLLIYHNLGSGKSRTAIEIVKQYFQYGLDVVIFCPASLKGNWLGQINQWDAANAMDIDLQGNPSSKGRYHLVSYNASNTVEKFMAMKSILNKSVVIIDEVHNFISNMVKTTCKRHQLYSEFMSLNSKIICLSATPMINNPYEVALLFNILKGYMYDLKGSRYTLFPSEKYTFDHLYVSGQNKMAFMWRINGHVSYFYGNNLDASYPRVVSHEIIKTVMSDHQATHYRNLRQKEAKEESFKGRGDNTDIPQSYKTKTRQASNFVFPPGVKRPSPRDTSITDQSYRPTLPISGVWTAEQQSVISQLLASVDDSNCEWYGNTLIAFRQKYKQAESVYESLVLLSELISNSNLTAIQALSIVFKDCDDLFIQSYNTGLSQSYDDAKGFIMKSMVNQAQYLNPSDKLIECSSKYKAMFDNIFPEFVINGSNGLCLIYSNFNEMEGLAIVALILQQLGYTRLTADQCLAADGKPIVSGKRYMIYSGEVDDVERNIIKTVFCSPENMHGEICKFFLGTSAAAEGLDLKYVQQVHIIEPHWHMVRIEQVIGRARRYRSHIGLPEDEQFVHVFQYHSVLPTNASESDDEGISADNTDEHIFELAIKKKATNDIFLQHIKNGAVDCNILLTQNKTDDNIINCVSTNTYKTVLYNINYNNDSIDADISREQQVTDIWYEKGTIRGTGSSRDIYFKYYGVQSTAELPTVNYEEHPIPNQNNQFYRRIYVLIDNEHIASEYGIETTTYKIISVP